MASAVDRDFSEVNLKLDANRRVLNALSQQTAERFDVVDQRFDGMDQRFDGMDQRFDRFERSVDARFEQVDENFATVTARLDVLAGGMHHITGLLTTLIDREDGAG